MPSVMASEKLRNQIEQNNNLVNALYTHYNNGSLYSQRAQRVYSQYHHIHAKLEKILPYNQFKHFKVPEKSCEICGYPVSSILTKHHVIPQSKGGKYGKIVMLCPTCHCSIHMSVDRGNIDLDIIRYLEGIEGAIEKFGMYVRMCAEA